MKGRLWSSSEVTLRRHQRLVYFGSNSDPAQRRRHRPIFDIKLIAHSRCGGLDSFLLTGFDWVSR